MKAFAIFPSICFFLLILALFLLGGKVRPGRAFVYATALTLIVGGLLIWASSNIFTFLYYSNFIGIIIAISNLTYLMNKMLPDTSGMRKWLRIFGLGVLSTVLTVTIFAASMFWAFLNNPESV